MVAPFLDTRSFPSLRRIFLAAGLALLMAFSQFSAQRANGAPTGITLDIYAVIVVDNGSGMMLAIALSPHAHGAQPLNGKSDCKNGGWQRYGAFDNQGQCVSFLNRLQHDLGDAPALAVGGETGWPGFGAVVISEVGMPALDAALAWINDDYKSGSSYLGAGGDLVVGFPEVNLGQLQANGRSTGSLTFYAPTSSSSLQKLLESLG